jgi:hypothetical protein
MLKRTTEEVAIYFLKRGCKLLGQYKGAMIKMKYQCACGQFGNTSWNNFTKGKRCGNCSKHGLKKKRSLQQVREIFVNRGCEFLDNEFNGIHYKHKFRCKCLHEGVITFAAFYHQNQLCYNCGLKKNSGPNHHEWIEDREQKRLNDLFRKKCHKALSSSLKAIGKEKVGHTSDLIGYGPKQLQNHIINHPNWESLKLGKWHLDHIFPIAAFIKYGINNLSLINHLDNLRPVTVSENLKKNDVYDDNLFLLWLQNHQ